jgi:ferritin-like metal-binding protein YciE
MPLKTPKDLFVVMLSDLRHGAERSHQIYDELGKAAQEPEIKEALNAREFISSQILSTLDECFRLIGEKPVPRNQPLYDAFVEDFRRELKEIQSPVVRKIFILTKASRLMHMRIGEYVALIAAADMHEHPAVGVLLESCLADKMAFVERTKRLIRAHIRDHVREEVLA